MKHLEAVESCVSHGSLDRQPAHAPLVELCRTLAAQMDASGLDPSTRLTAAYLSALKDLRRALGSTPARQSRTSSLAALQSNARSRRGGAA